MYFVVTIVGNGSLDGVDIHLQYQSGGELIQIGIKYSQVEDRERTDRVEQNQQTELRGFRRCFGSVSSRRYGVPSRSPEQCQQCGHGMN